MPASCTICDGDYYYRTLHGGKERGLIRTELDADGKLDWDFGEQIDFIRLPSEQERYLQMILGMLIALEMMTKER